MPLAWRTSTHPPGSFGQSRPSAFINTVGARRQRTEIPKYWATNKPELFGVTILDPISYILGFDCDDQGASQPNRAGPRNKHVSRRVDRGRSFAEQHLRRRLAAASIIVIGVIAFTHG